MTRISGSSLIWGTQCIDSPGWVLAPWQRLNFPNSPVFTWNKNGIPNSSNYGDNRLLITIGSGGVPDISFDYASTFNVRVSRPSVKSNWWWTSYLINNDVTKKIANISKVASSWYADIVKNKNFVWAWIWWDVSSYSKDISQSNAINFFWNESYYDSLSVTNSFWTNWTNFTSTVNDFSDYHWISNISVLENKDFRLNSSTLNSLTWNRTYIVENGDIIIDSDISYPDNIAFVTKWWNIRISSSVKNMDWTYITIPRSYLWSIVLHTQIIFHQTILHK